MKKIILLGVALLFLLVSFGLWLMAAREATSPSALPPGGVLPLTTPSEPVPPKLLTDEVDSTPEASFATVLDLLYLDVYDIYTCEALGPDEATLLVTAKYTPDATGLNTTAAAEVAVLAWESRMLMDLGHLIFPSVKENSFTTPLSFAQVPGTAMRSAKVEINGTMTTVAYGWLLNYVLFSTSLDCLEATMKTVYEHDV